MAIKFFDLLVIGDPRKTRWLNALSKGVAAGILLLAGLSAAHAGLLTPSKDRSQGDALFQQATTAYQGGDYAGALRLLEQADALKPDQADAWNLRGVVLLKQRAFDKSEAAFARSVALDPTLWAAQFNLAEVFFQKKDFARARTNFDHLLAQTDRYKAANKWELVVYKGFLCALLAGDESDARKKLAKLPATGGATPAFLYAQAALAFSHKDTAGGNKILAGAQTAYAPALNGLFTSSLETAGWQTPAVNLLPSGPAVTVDPATAAAMNAAGLTNPAGNAASPGVTRVSSERPAATIDPRLIAASDPLPSGPGQIVMPVAGQPAPTGKSNPSRHPAKDNVTLPSASPTPASVRVEPANTPPPSPFDQNGLLLGAD